MILPLEFLAVVGSPLLYDVNEVVRQNERHPLPVDAKLALEVPKKVAEVNVEQLRKKKKTVIAPSAYTPV